MPIPAKYLAMFEPERTYHVLNRSHQARKLFHEHSDYEYFLSLFTKHLHPALDVHAFCLLPNHFHFIVRVKSGETQANVSNLFRKFFIAYANRTNKKYGLRGNLFSTPFRRVLITDDAHYSKGLAYVHLNAAKHSIYNGLDYKYSSYSETRDLTSNVCDSHYVINWFGGKEKYEHFHKLMLAELLPG